LAAHAFAEGLIPEHAGDCPARYVASSVAARPADWPGPSAAIVVQIIPAAAVEVTWIVGWIAAHAEGAVAAAG